MSSRLSKSIHQSIRQNYDLSIEAATPIGTGAMSTTLKLATNRGTFFLKCYKSPPDPDTTRERDLRRRILFSHAVQKFLHKKGVPAPRLLPNKKGETLSVLGNQIYALSEFVEGHDYEPGNATDRLQSAAEMLGRLHQQLCGFQSPVEPAWQPMETEIVAQLKDRLSRLQPAVEADADAPISRDQTDLWCREVDTLIADCHVSKKWVIHGDYRAQNLKFAGHRICAILDLDTARPAHRLYDLGYALVFFPAVYQDFPLTPDEKSIFLSAYEGIYPLSESERERLPYHLKFAFLRGMTLWLKLYYFAGMRQKTRPWIQAYLRDNAEGITRWC